MNADQSDSDNDSEYDDDDRYAHVTPDLLQIIKSIVNDRYTGAASKHIFERAPGQSHISLDFRDEVMLYNNYHIRQELRNLLGDSARYFFWLVPFIAILILL